MCFCALDLAQDFVRAKTLLWKFGRKAYVGFVASRLTLRASILAYAVEDGIGHCLSAKQN